MNQFRSALRALFKAPFVTSVAIASLALGIGANTAIFSLFDQMLLRSLPVFEPERLVNLNAPGPKYGSQSSNNAGKADAVFSYPMFRDLQREQTLFTGIAAHRSFGANLAFQGQTMSGEGMLVSGNYFSVLGARPGLGRLFGPEDDRTVGGHPVVVLSHDYWRARFDSSPTALEKTLIVNGQVMTIVGVAPKGFRGTTLGVRPQVFVPITMRGAMVPGWEGFEDRRSYWVYVFARLQPGRSLEEAQTALNVPYRAIINEIEAPLQSGMSDQTLATFKAKVVTLDEGWNGQSNLHEHARAPLVLLLSVTGIVLLIACANIANLLLARGTGRAAEMAVRVSIGANRPQLVAQLLTESCLLGVFGGLGGLIVARWTLDMILAMLPTGPEAFVDAQLHPPVLVFTALLALAAGLAFGLFPALHATRPDVASALKGQRSQPAGGRGASRFRAALATSQIALSMALLASAGLFTKSLFNISRVDLGLRTDNLVTFGLSPELNGYAPVQSRALFERLEAKLATEPGVTAATASLVPLIDGSNWGSSVTVEAFEAGPDTDTESNFNRVGPDFFSALDIPLMSGRGFTPGDAGDAPKVVVVNEAFAKKFHLGRDAVGRRMGIGKGDLVPLDLEIIGVVRDAKYSEVKDAVPPQYFLPYRQAERVGRMRFYVRTAVDPEDFLATIPGIVARLDPNLPVEVPRTMDAQVRDNVSPDRMVSTLSAAFALLATLLATVGLYGVLAYTVAQRTREIGVRMALGADRARVRGMVLGQVARMTFVGGVLGIAAAIALGRVAQSLLYELEPTDPVVLLGAVVALTLVALASGLVPALRASRVEPMRALRYE
jgi:predicted permease